jgi:hypothetical protein
MEHCSLLDCLDPKKLARCDGEFENGARHYGGAYARAQSSFLVCKVVVMRQNQKPKKIILKKNN